MANIIMITGATSGIGEATANIFARNGWKVIITGRRKERLFKLKTLLEKEYSANIFSLDFDVRVNEEVEKAIDSLPEEWKKIDVLINNAGLAVGLGPIQEGELGDWERMIDTNLKGLLYVTRKISPGMAERQHGHIVNIGSIAGKEAYPNGNVYCASKFAVDGLTKGMRMDLVKYGIKVTHIAPGAINTEFSLVRFKGDKPRADNVYTGYQPLSGNDVAEVIYYTVNLPAHILISDLVITPAAQAAATIIHRNT